VERFAKTATDRTLAIVESLLKFATSRRHTLVELTVSWLASNPTVASVIAGATSPEQVRTNASAAKWSFTTDELTEIERLLSQLH
jgi:aryl-alcohol dehydrogenase-like predicted oxidoreductase